MKSNLTTVAALALVASAATGCSAQKGATTSTTAPEPAKPEAVAIPAEPIMPVTPSVAMLPKAVIYRTSAPSDSLVPVTVTGGRLVSFPAPTDLTVMPEKLKDGWLLDTRGINPDTRFTRWTYAEYKTMKTAPSTAEIMDSLVPDLAVTEIATLPYTVGQATPEMADSLIANGLKDCVITYRR
ncbi:MAG: hypothetical protein NC339_02275 [Muribaculaceae bacterium]|nr:hypothetical protein [Muribaculaceae bacterium]